jgi:hypothetical protein
MPKDIVGFRTDWKDELKRDAVNQRRTVSEVVEFIVDTHYKSLGYHPPLVDEIKNQEQTQEGIDG